MRRALIAILALLVTAPLAGCIGGDDTVKAVVVYSPVDGKSDTFLFDASGSNGRGLSYNWSFGDGGMSSEARTEYTYEYGAAVYDVHLVLTDEDGNQDAWQETVQVGDGQNGAPSGLFEPSQRIYALDSAVRVDASASTDPERDPLEYRWDFNHLISFAEYEDFRAAKADAGGGDAGDKGGLAPQDLLETAEASVEGLLGGKHTGHGGGDTHNPSLFTHTATTTEPVYMFTDGFPEENVFFIRLQVYDVKGGHEEIRSEEIWAVEAMSAPPAASQNAQVEGHFNISVDSQLEPHIPEQLSGEYQYNWTWETAWAIAPATTVGEELHGLSYVNVTWSLMDETPVPYNNRLDLVVTSPDGKSFRGREVGNDKLIVELDGRDGFPAGPWSAHITARQGAQIDWQLEHRFRFDLNPFGDLETA